MDHLVGQLIILLNPVTGEGALYQEALDLLPWITLDCRAGACGEANTNIVLDNSASSTRPLLVVLGIATGVLIRTVAYL